MIKLKRFYSENNSKYNFSTILLKIVYLKTVKKNFLINNFKGTAKSRILILKKSFFNTKNRKGGQKKVSFMMKKNS